MKTQAQFNSRLGTIMTWRHNWMWSAQRQPQFYHLSRVQRGQREKKQTVLKACEHSFLINDISVSYLTVLLDTVLKWQAHLNTLLTSDPHWPSACWGSSWHNAVPFLCASPASHGQMSLCPGFSTSQTAPGKQCSEHNKQKGLVDFCENRMVRVVLQGGDCVICP